MMSAMRQQLTPCIQQIVSTLWGRGVAAYGGSKCKAVMAALQEHNHIKKVILDNNHSTSRHESSTEGQQKQI